MTQIDEPNLDEQIEEIVGKHWAMVTGQRPIYEHATSEETKQAIKELIANQVREARIDELEHIVSGSEYSADDFDWYEKTQDEYTGTRYYSEVRHLSKTDRIAELKAQQEEV